MDDEIQLIADGDGLAVIGDRATVERFLVSEGLPSRALRPRRFRSALGDAAGAAQVASDIAAGSGRWVKLSKGSARRIDQLGLRKSAKTGLSTGVLKGPKGQSKGFVEFAKGPGPLRGNPAQMRTSRRSWRSSRCSKPWTRSPTTSPRSTRSSTTCSAPRRTTRCRRWSERSW